MTPVNLAKQSKKRPALSQAAFAHNFPQVLCFDCRRQRAGKLVHRRTLRNVLGSGLLESQASPLHKRHPPVDHIVAEAVDAQGVLSSQHLPRPDRVQDAQLILGEAFGVDDGFLFDLLFRLRFSESGRGFDVVGEHGGFHFLQDCFMFIRGVVFECVEAEFNCFGDLFLAELAAHIRCSLDD